MSSRSLPDQIGILGKALHQDRARAFEGCCDVRHLLLGVDEARGHGLRIVLRLRQQQLGQRLKPGFLGDLGLGAALRLVRQDRYLPDAPCCRPP
jgi:hypothetical protein